MAHVRDNRVTGQVTYRSRSEPPPDVVVHALRYSCPDCLVNTEIYQDERGKWAVDIAHDETCPWLNAKERRS